MIFMGGLCFLGAAGLYHFARVMGPYEDHSRSGDSSSWAFFGAVGLFAAGLWLVVSAFRPRWKG